MTLREEIETVLDNVWGDVEISGGTDVKEYADEILKLFEKWIDATEQLDIYFTFADRETILSRFRYLMKEELKK